MPDGKDPIITVHGNFHFPFNIGDKVKIGRTAMGGHFHNFNDAEEYVLWGVNTKVKTAALDEFSSEISLDHDEVCRIDFSKGVAFVCQSGKGRYRRIEVDTKHEIVKVPHASAVFGKPVYDHYLKYLDSLVVK